MLRRLFDGLRKTRELLGEGLRAVLSVGRDLDDAFRADRVVVRGGYRSVLVLPLDGDARQVLWLAHREPNTYTDAHARALRPVADLATLAIEHDQLRTLLHERRRKREALETLLPTLARALDVQVVFDQISAVVRDVRGGMASIFTRGIVTTPVVPFAMDIGPTTLPIVVSSGP